MLRVSREGRLVLLAASVLGVWLWGPDLVRLTTHFVGAEGVDHYGTQWFYWFVARQLKAGHGFGFTHLLFYPFGKDIFLHTGSNVLDALVALPFRLLLGPVTGYNIFVLTGWSLGGFAAWWLARTIVQDRVAAAAAAIFFLFAPFALYELEAGRPTQALLGLLPWYVGLLRRLGQRPGWRATVGAGVVLALIGYQYWYYAIFLALVSVVHAAWLVISPPAESGGRRSVLLRHFLAGSLAVALVAPVVTPMLVMLANPDSPVPGLLATDRWNLAASPTVTRAGTQVALMVWQPASMTGGHYWQDASGAERYMPFQRSLAWISLIWLILWLLRPGPLERLPWLLMVLLSLLVAVGPVFVVGRTTLPNPVYLGLARLLPPFERLWWPGRSLAVTITLLVPVTAIAFARARARGWRLFAVSVVGGTLWLAWDLGQAHLLPFPAWDATIPAGYHCLAQGDRAGAILELPYAWSQAHLYYQTAHGRPIFGGMLEDNPAFTPPESVALRKQNTFVSALLATARQEAVIRTPVKADREALRRMGYRYVVLQLDAYGTAPPGAGLADNARRTLRRRVLRDLSRFLGPPVYEDARVAIFSPWGDGAPCAPETWPRDLSPAHPPPPERHLVGSLTDPAFAVHRFNSPGR